MTFPSVEEQLVILERGAIDVVDRADLKQRLEQSRKEDRPLRVKFGGRA